MGSADRQNLKDELGGLLEDVEGFKELLHKALEDYKDAREAVGRFVREQGGTVTYKGKLYTSDLALGGYQSSTVVNL